MTMRCIVLFVLLLSISRGCCSTLVCDDDHEVNQCVVIHVNRNKRECSADREMSREMLYDYHSIKRSTDKKDCCRILSQVKIASNDSYCCAFNCDSFHDAVAKALNKQWDRVTILLKVSKISLNQSLSFKKSPPIAIMGNLTHKTQIKCSGNQIGIIFNESSNITLRNLKIKNCGIKKLYPRSNTAHAQKFKIYYSAAMILTECTNVTVDRVSVISSHGIGMAVFNIKGMVTITNSTFANNKMKKASNSGGGLHMTIWSANKTIIKMEECVFTRNVKHRYNGAYAGLQSGGGLHIRLSNSTTAIGPAASNISIHILRCNFTHNRADWGGGMFIGILGSASFNHISVQDCRIAKNKAIHIKGWGNGGGLDVGFYRGIGKVLYAVGNTVSFTRVVIDSNEAVQGGGSTIYSAISKARNHIIFNNCTWSNNTAYYSSAVLASPKPQNTIEKGKFAFKLDFINCSFLRNKLNDDDPVSYEVERKKVFRISSPSAFTLGAGLMASLSGNIAFIDNDCTAIDIYLFSKLRLRNHSNILFSGNKGRNGGGLSVTGFSIFRVGAHSIIKFLHNEAEFGGGIFINEESWVHGEEDIEMHFENNTAELGGAIYYALNEKKLLSTADCFMDVYHNTTLSFRNNRALSEYGDIMYASTLQPCIKFCKRKIRNCNQTDLVDQLKCCLKNISIADKYKKKSIITSSQTITGNNSEMIYTKPGQLLKLDLAVFDELKNNITKIKVFKVQSSPDNPDFQIDSNIKYTTTRAVRVYGKPNTTGVLTLHVLEDVSNLMIKYTVTLTNCPPGYKINEDASHKKCTCNHLKYYDLHCEDDDIISYTSYGTWVGYVDPGNELTSSPCPLGFCKYQSKLNRTSLWLCNLPSDKHNLSDLICETGRKGTLCGQCIEGYSVAYHSLFNECKKDSDSCKYGFVLYILAEWIPVTVLFLFVLLCNINFTSGAINGFILFAQVIDVMYMEGSNTKPLLLNIHTFVYGILNLSFDTTYSSLTFCIWKGATTLEILAMKYVTILYSLILVLCLVKLLNHCTCFKVCRFCRKQSFGNSIIYGLSAFLLMCYSQCARVTLLILQPAILLKEGPKSFKFVAFMNGNLQYFGKDHWPYASIAILFFIVLIAGPPFVLIFNIIMIKCLKSLYKRGYNISTKWANRFEMVKFKPMFDTFQGCYRDNCRVFAGLYFIYKVGFLFMSILLVRAEMLFNIVSLVMMVLILILHTYVQPYKVRTHNVMDSLLLLNIVMINALSIVRLYLIYILQLDVCVIVNDDCSVLYSTIEIIQSILVYIPIVCVVLHTLWRQCSKSGAFRRVELNKSDKGFYDEDLPARLLSTTYTSCNYK